MTDMQSNEATKQPQEAPAMGLTGKTALVHKKGEEGTLEIDAFTGAVLPDQHDRPDWAHGLVMAQLAERHIFYKTRLGEAYANEHKNPDLFAFEDLGWLAVDTENPEAEAPIERMADDEHRMEVIATVLGINRDTGQIEGEDQMVTAEVALDHSRTGDEMRAFTEAQERGFEPATKTGTEG